MPDPFPEPRHPGSERRQGWVGSLLPFHQEMRQRFERFGAFSETGKGGATILDQRIGSLNRLVDAKQCRIRDLLSRHVFSGSLAQLFGSLGYIENVVDNLER